MSLAWDQARAASLRPLPGARPLAEPVGVRVEALVAAMRLPDVSRGEPETLWNLRRLEHVHANGYGQCLNDWLDICCQTCGHHVCSCEVKKP